ncbi:MAG: prephenate dehydrogenase/arogenate dehydrogenase family protein [Gammaproteobacteria bacterium]|nr:prephenate dehydrogenase/arogenate dehydrogenase family protein [Gammaproteobacteria bacterium]
MSNPVPPIEGKVVILGGGGAMGTLLSACFSGVGMSVTVVDLVSAPVAGRHNVSCLTADVRALQGEARSVLGEADWVSAALPEKLLLETWETIVGLLAPGALFVDTLSVKLPLIGAMNARMPGSIEVLSINPMFAPSLGFAGQSVAVIELKCGERAALFLHLLQSLGARLIKTGAEQHDRNAAMLQAATHAAIIAFGAALRRLDYDIEAMLPLMTPPHRAMLALLARILGASPEVYWDIQAENPFAPAARRAIEEAMRELSATVDKQDPAHFLGLLEELRHMFGMERLAKFGAHGARMLQRDTE